MGQDFYHVCGAKSRCGSITDGGESVDTLILQYRMITKGYFLS
jgi:hypothetical protein